MRLSGSGGAAAEAEGDPATMRDEKPEEPRPDEGAVAQRRHGARRFGMDWPVRGQPDHPCATPVLRSGLEPPLLIRHCSEVRP